MIHVIVLLCNDGMDHIPVFWSGHSMTTSLLPPSLHDASHAVTPVLGGHWTIDNKIDIKNWPLAIII